MRRALAAFAVVATLAAGYVVLDVYDLVPGALTDGSSRTPSAATTSGGTPAATPTSLPTYSVATATPLAALDPAAPVPAAAALTTRLTPLLTDPALGQASMLVRDVVTGRTLFARAATVPRTPASNTKLLSAAAIDTVLPGSTTLPTTVVQGPAADEITLVAGGDTLLSPGAGSATSVAGRAGLADLADQVAAALSARGRRQVRLALDLSFAAGPTIASTWQHDDVPNGDVGAVTMLGLSSDQATDGHPAPADPTAAVATRLRDLLATRGIVVTGPTTTARAAAGAAVLGRVESAPVRNLLELALETSDNTLTEVLARVAAARSGAPTDFAGTGSFIVSRVASLGVDVTGTRLLDASGLSHGNQVTAQTVSDVLQLGLTGRDVPLSETLADLAVGGLSGTLTYRFDGPDSSAGRGMVRGKTGTLIGVDALAGYVVTADGRLLSFVVIANAVPAGGTVAARTLIDRAAATLAGCGCR